MLGINVRRVRRSQVNRQRRYVSLARQRHIQKNKANISVADRVEEIRILCKEISAVLSKVETWVSALLNVSAAVREKSVLKDLVGAVSALDLYDKREELKDVSIDDYPTNYPGTTKSSEETIETLVRTLRNIRNTLNKL